MTWSIVQADDLRQSQVDLGNRRLEAETASLFSEAT